MYENIYKNIPSNAIEFVNSNPLVVYILLMPLVILIIYSVITFVVNIIARITIYPLFDTIENKLKQKSILFNRIVGAIFQVPKAISYVLVITFVLNFVSLLNVTDTYNKYLEESQAYNYISKEVVIPLTNSKLAKKLPDIVNNSFTIVVKDASSSESNVQNNNKRGIIYAAAGAAAGTAGEFWCYVRIAGASLWERSTAAKAGSSSYDFAFATPKMISA